MNIKHSPSRPLLRALLVLAVACGASAASAQPAAAPADAATAAPSPAATAPIGDATRGLLRMQRESGGTARSIPGDVAGLSYERYLNSFKHPIPNTLGSAVRKAGAEQAR